MQIIIDWIASNAATIAVSAVLAAIVAAVIVKMIKDKKEGKSSCGCGCEGCALSGKCKTANKNKKDNV